MILRSRGAKAPLLSVDLMSVSVGLISREGGLLSPCSWTCGCEIYTTSSFMLGKELNKPKV